MVRRYSPPPLSLLLLLAWPTALPPRLVRASKPIEFALASSCRCCTAAGEVSLNHSVPWSSGRVLISCSFRGRRPVKQKRQGGREAGRKLVRLAGEGGEKAGRRDGASLVNILDIPSFLRTRHERVPIRHVRVPVQQRRSVRSPFLLLIRGTGRRWQGVSPTVTWLSPCDCSPVLNSEA